MTIKLYIALIPMLLLPASFAQAETENEPDRVSASNASLAPYALDHDLRFDVSTGFFAGPNDGGVTLGADVLRRVGLFEYGLDATFGNQFWGYSYGQANAAAGLGWQSRSGFRLDAIGEFGGTYYYGVGQALFSDNPGVNGIAPTAGAKAGVSYVFMPNTKGHLSVGLWFSGEDDLTRDTKSVSYVEHNLFDTQATATTTNETIGTARAGATISLGGVLPF